MPDSFTIGQTNNPLEPLELACSSLFDEVPCYISIQDRDFQVLQANRRIIEDFGDPLSKKCYAVYKGRSERCLQCPVAETFADGKDHTSGEVLFDRRGLPHHVIVQTRPLEGRNDGIVAVMELFTDITVQKELEHRLLDSMNRFHNLFDVTPCFISVQDRDFRIIEANQYFKESFGRGLDRHCYEVYKQRRERCPECPVAETFKDGRSHSTEEVLVDRNNHELHVMVHTAPLRNAEGHLTSVMEVSDDITEIHALQDKLASLGGLIAGIAHSIKNVLEGLRGGIYIGNLGFRDNQMEDVKKGWEMVERNVDRLSAMILDMLYYAKDRPPRRLPVSLSAVAREVMELYLPRAAQFGVKLEADLSDDINILGEPKDIHALLANLIGNGLDACLSDPTEGKPHRVSLRLFRQTNEAVIEVADNGFGMDEETCSKLFTMFFSTKGAFGTGLGLMVCRKVATEHGGSIAVKSTPGNGATFTVKFPLRATEGGAS